MLLFSTVEVVGVAERVIYRSYNIE